jgi:hypothetical protein
MIRDGKIVLVEDIEVVKQHRRKIFAVSVDQPSQIIKMKQLGISVVF